MHWSEISPADAVNISLPWDGPNGRVEAPLNEIGEPCPWPWEPQQLKGAPLGQYHCGHCGGMCVAGVPHPEWTPELIAEMEAANVGEPADAKEEPSDG